MGKGAKKPAAGVASTVVALAIASVFVILVAAVSIVPGLGSFRMADLSRKPVAISKVNFPDDVLRSYVRDGFDTNEDGYLDLEETEGVVSLGVYDTSTYAVTQPGLQNRGITSLTGLSVFPNLQMLVASDNDIATLDLASMPSLRYVDMRGNPAFGITYGAANFGTQIVIDEGTEGNTRFSGLDMRTPGSDAGSAG